MNNSGGPLFNPERTPHRDGGSSERNTLTAKIWIPGRPVVKKKSGNRRGKGGGVIGLREAHEFEARIRNHAAAQLKGHKFPIFGRKLVAMLILAYWQPRDGRDKLPDTDSIPQCICDALQSYRHYVSTQAVHIPGIMYENDNQVTKLTVEKIPNTGCDEGIEVTVWER